MKELERHWDERPGAEGRKRGTGVAPQALFGPRGGTLKIFEVDRMECFYKKSFLRGQEVLFEGVSFQR